MHATCKHCGQRLTVGDAPGQPPVTAPFAAPLPKLYAGAPTDSDEEDATHFMGRSATPLSVHDEPTMIGRVPIEALNAERMFAQRTQPPPPPPASARASVPDVLSLQQLLDDAGMSSLDDEPEEVPSSATDDSIPFDEPIARGQASHPHPSEFAREVQSLRPRSGLIAGALLAVLVVASLTWLALAHGKP